MGMPIEDAARERVINNAELNIENAKREAIRILTHYLAEESKADVWAEDMELVSYNSVRNSYIAMFSNWNFPDRFITVQQHNGILYSHISQNLLRDTNQAQFTQPSLF